MLVYRVFPYLASVKAGQPGHPLYVHPEQGTGRFDNPAQYLAWYMADLPTAAVGESFGDLSVWRDEMFPFPRIPGSRRALGTYRLPDELPYVDLDDPQRLVELGVRPSQVVERNRPYTRALALRIYQQGPYNGLRWWSFHRPQWRVYCLWEIGPTIEVIDHLSLSFPAVRDAATTLSKPLG